MDRRLAIPGRLPLALWVCVQPPTTYTQGLLGWGGGRLTTSFSPTRPPPCRQPGPQGFRSPRDCVCAATGAGAAAGLTTGALLESPVLGSNWVATEPGSELLEAVKRGVPSACRPGRSGMQRARAGQSQADCCAHPVPVLLCPLPSLSPTG